MFHGIQPVEGQHLSPYLDLQPVDTSAANPYVRARREGSSGCKEKVMKVLNSLKSAKKRDKNCRIVRRKGRVYVINKRNPRFKARQG